MTLTANIQKPESARANRCACSSNPECGAFTTVEVMDRHGSYITIFLPDTGHAEVIAATINAAIAAGKPKLEDAQ